MENTTNNIIKKKPGQKSKAIKYPIERKEIAKKILKIIGITNDNKTLILNDFDIDLQQEILDLEEDIKKYYNAGRWAVYKKGGKEVEKAYLSITRNVMKENGVIMINSTKYINGKQLSCYMFELTDDFFVDTI